MPRHSEKSHKRQAVRDYLESAIFKTPEEHPINVKKVAEDVGLSRTSIYKYGFDVEIQSAVIEQRKNARKSGKFIEKQVYQDIIGDLRRDLEKERQIVKSLQTEIMLIEANSCRLGIDPEELRVAITKPDRSVSRAGSNKKRSLHR
ncbi:MAG: hypothetical protein H0U87_03070 [Acidobacteria bacterium]|jgi:transposase-like protein|nr:hypothetical protein [Acidobacteriota bacterium]